MKNKNFLIIGIIVFIIFNLITLFVSAGSRQDAWNNKINSLGTSETLIFAASGTGCSDPICTTGQACYTDVCCCALGDCCDMSCCGAPTTCNPPCARCTKECMKISGVYQCISSGKTLCEDGTCKTMCPQCYDSDGGKIYDVAGYTVWPGSGNANKYDSCSGTGILNEKYCNLNNEASINYNCPSGCCSGGVCVSGTSKTCAQLGKQCGNWPNQCGGTLTCPDCPTGQTCNSTGQCNVVTCTPETDPVICSTRLGGANCGSFPVYDNCGTLRTVNCGSCTLPETCQSGTCVCTPETNPQFCARQALLGKNCGSITAPNNCGDSKTVNCGGCTPPAICTNNVCVCTAETDPTFCSRKNKNCGSLTDYDNCGTWRTVTDCGTCTSPAICSSGICCTPESNATFCSKLGKTCGSATGTDNCGSPRTVSECCGSEKYCADSSSGLCCDNGKICADEYKIQLNTCTKQTTKNCFDCACHDNFLGDILSTCSGSPIMVGKCTASQGCCYGNCFDLTNQKCCAKDACDNSIIEKTECCTIEPGSSAPYIYYLNSTPDFYNDFKNQKEVSYTDVFNKQVKFQIKVNDSDCKENSLTVFYNITGLSWETPTSISSSISCQKNTLCEITIPSDKIRPGDSPTIIAYAQDSDKINSTINSTSIQIPNFNIVVDGVSPIQVLEGATLIKGKPTMFRIKYHILSDLITKAENINALASLAGNQIISTANLKKYPAMSEILTNKDEQSYSDLKEGKDTVNLFSITPSTIGNVAVYAELNKNKNLKESNMSDNNKSGTSNIIETKKLYLVFVPMEIGSWENGYNQAEFTSTVAENLLFIKDVYPVAPGDVSYKINSPSSFLTPAPAMDPNTDDDSYLMTVYTQSLLLPELSAIKTICLIKNCFTGIANGADIRVIGIVPGDSMHMLGATHWLSQDVAIIKVGQTISGQTTENIIAHEIGHTYGLGTPEEYETNPYYGNLASNGWRVSKNQDGAIINLGSDSSQEQDITFFISPSGSKSFVGLKSNLPNIHCMMGIPPRKAWIDTQDYNSLINTLKK